MNVLVLMPRALLCPHLHVLADGHAQFPRLESLVQLVLCQLPPANHGKYRPHLLQLQSVMRMDYLQTILVVEFSAKRDLDLQRLSQLPQLANDCRIDRFGVFVTSRL